MGGASPPWRSWRSCRSSFVGRYPDFSIFAPSGASRRFNAAEDGWLQLRMLVPRRTTPKDPLIPGRREGGAGPPSQACSSGSQLRR